MTGPDERTACRLLAEMLGARELPAPKPVIVSLPTASATPLVAARIKEILQRNRGPRQVKMRLFNGESSVILSLGMRTSSAVVPALRELLGENAVEEA